MEVLTAEDWLDATKVQEFDTEAAYRKALGALRGKARSKFSPQIGAAIKQAAVAIGQAPTDPLAVAPYLPPGFNIDILKQLDVNPSGEVPLLRSIGGAGPKYIFADRPVDIWDGTHFYNTEGGFVIRGASFASGEVAVAAAITTFTHDNGAAPTQISDLTGYKDIDTLPPAQVDRIFKALTTKM